MDSDNKPEEVCGFCDKSRDEVELLVARHGCIDAPVICCECVAQCLDIMFKQAVKKIREVNTINRSIAQTNRDTNTVERVRGLVWCKEPCADCGAADECSVSLPELRAILERAGSKREDPA